MHNIEIRKYKPKTNKNYKSELKRMSKINPNEFESKLIKKMEKLSEKRRKEKIEQKEARKNKQKREKNIRNSLINENDDYSLSLVNVYKGNKFRNYEFSFRLNVNNNVNNIDVLNNVINSTYEEIERFSKIENIEIDKTAKIQFILDSDELKSPIPSDMRYFNRKNEIIQDMDKRLLNVLQSDERYSGGDSVIHVRLFAGYSGSGYKQLLHKSEIAAGKKCIIQIKNDDNLCMIRAIAVGHAINNNDPLLKSINDPLF